MSTGAVIPIAPVVSTGPCDCLNHCGDDERVSTGHVQPCEAEHRRMLMRAMERSAWNIADRQCLVVIRSEGVAETIGGVLWYDCGPMTDDREVSPATADENRELVGYALARRLAHAHPRRHATVRIVDKRAQEGG